MIKIKFCGLSRVEDINFVNELCSEYIGFVFYKKSKRYVAPETAAALKKILRKEISAVGVFVDAPIDFVASLNFLDAIQLHGNESETYIKNLRGLTNKIIIKAFRFDAIKNTAADFILIDAGAGDGKTFDWTKINLQREYFLAGGLNPENVSTAIKILKPFAVDVSSGIETGGRKDFSKMKKFIRAVRGEFYDK